MTAPTASSTSPLLWPSIGLVIGGALWGIIWLPLRALGGMGLNGAWPALVMFLGTLVVLLPFILFRIRRLSAIWLPLTLSGAFTGMAFSFYATSISLTEVVRAVLLFYLTPVWGTALGMIFLGERLSAARVAAIVLGLGGLFVILGDAGLPIPRNAGDWLALISGLSWAFGSLAVYRLKEPGIGEQIVAFLLGTTVVTLA
ncbi:MAG: DMT family transporter [Pseudomonadota bacterium]